jgi:hypothetical protein
MSRLEQFRQEPALLDIATFKNLAEYRSVEIASVV